MAGVAQDFIKNGIANFWVRGTAFSFISAVHVGLLVGGVEVVAAGYARKPIAFGVETGGQCFNSGAISFAAAGALWGDISGYGIFDAASAGNLLYLGAFSAEQTINTGEVKLLAAGEIAIGLTCQSAYIRKKSLEHTLGVATAGSAPGTRRLALYNGTVELTGGGYARINPTFAAAVGGICLNSAVATFANATADWGLLTHAELRDSATINVGNQLFRSALDPTVTIPIGNSVTLPASALSFGVS